MSTDTYVFGYGSLVAPVGRAPDRTVRAGGFVADLAGMRRMWGVAMDNRRDLPGYKYYLDPSGRRPALYVAFLDIAQATGPGAAVNGLCLPADGAALAALDLRERNYTRIDVTERIVGARAGMRIFTYVGSPAGRDRLARGRAGQTAVIHAGYLDAVRAGFAALGEAERAACEPSLAPGELPVVPLTRCELP